MAGRLSAEVLGVLRLLAGFGLGGALPLDFSLTAELLPRRNRGRHLVLLESFWAVGTVTIAALAFALVSTVGWRPLLASSALAALLVLWIRLRVPESPRYLLRAGRPEEARAVLARVAERNDAELPQGELVPPPASEGASGLTALWTRAPWRTTLMLWAAWFAIGLAYYGLFVYLPTIFVDRGLSFVQTYGYTFILALAQIPGYLSAAWLVERWGRRRTLVSYLAASAAFSLLFAFADLLALVVAAACLVSFLLPGRLGGAVRLHARVLPDPAARHGHGLGQRHDAHRRGPGDPLRRLGHRRLAHPGPRHLRQCLRGRIRGGGALGWGDPRARP